MNAAQRVTSTGRDLKAFPGPVAAVLREAINEHGVTYRMLDGGHVRLYTGQRSVIPFKISASRPAEHTLRRLGPWLAEHVPTWKEPEMEVTPDAIRTLAAVVNTTPEPEPEAVSPWRPYVPASGNDYGFDTDGETFRCRVCGWERADARGLHLHHNSHTGAATEASARARETRALRGEQRRTMIASAIAVLAEEHGLRVTDTDPADLDALRADNERLRAEVERLTRANEDLDARLALIKDAMGA